jgi:hypothetical protein
MVFMALIKLGGGIVGISGSMAGNTYSRNSAGSYLRSRTKPVNPNSVYQAAVRNYLSMLVERWNGVLTAEQRGAWETYAAAVNMQNRIGENIKISGFDHYLRVNIVRLQLEQTKCDDGPTTLTLVETDPTFAISASVATQQISCTWDTDLPWGDIPASIMGFWMGRPQVKTRNFFNGPWRKMGSVAGNGISPSLQTAPFTLVLGQKIWVYARIATGPTDSRLSRPFSSSCIVAA